MQCCIGYLLDMYIHLSGTLVVKSFDLRALFSLKIIHKTMRKQNEKIHISLNTN